MQESKLRYVFWPFWFILVPLALGSVLLWLLTPARDALDVDSVRAFIREQPIPSLIVLFTLFEVLLYHWRYQLPLAARVGVAGRLDVPSELRADFEQAGHLLEEARRILKKHRKSVKRSLSEAEQQRMQFALEALRTQTQREQFNADEFGQAYSAASQAVAAHLSRWRKSELREYTESILIAFIVALLLRAFVVEAFKIPSGSMLPTLQIQDHIFVNKFAYGPKVPFTNFRLWRSFPPRRGDIVVFEFPDPNPANPRQDYIKRVIAVPGDTLEVVAGHPIINGWRVPHCDVGHYEYSEGDRLAKSGELFVEFLGDYSYLTLFEDLRGDGRQGPYHVAPGEIWVLGDNRNNSSDSRAWNHGVGAGAPFDNIKGRALFVWLNFQHLERLGTNVMGQPELPAGAPQELVERIDSCLAQRPSVTLPPAG